MKKLLTERLSVLIPDGENEHALWTTRCLAQAPEVKVHILSTKRWMPVRFSRHCHLYEFKPTGRDSQERINAIADIIRWKNIDVILPVSESGAEFAASEHRNLAQLAAITPIPSLHSLQIAQNKWKLNQFACLQQVPVPRSILVSSTPHFYLQLAKLEYPVLIKPVIGSDGQGIQRFECPSDLLRFLERRADVQDNYIVEDYIPGYDIDLSVLCHQGEILAYTIQLSLISASERFGPLMAMQFIEQPEVLENGRKLFSALNWSGVAHIDMRYDNRDGQFKIVDVNPRYWGSLLGSFVVGINFPYLACLAALEIPFPLPQYHPGKFIHTTTALKEMTLRLFGKGRLEGFAYKETGLRFFVDDPMPEIVKKAQEFSFMN
ncbi:MAG: ATP-grasp domain-containing protein [Anaerolineales bacterium]|nr:ATP-grasp domain-containing protein [Anaerolineales bacterium]